jgi:hypothetical protein
LLALPSSQLNSGNQVVSYSSLLLLMQMLTLRFARLAAKFTATA